jgi:S1-C subfamily serine protease
MPEIMGFEAKFTSGKINSLSGIQNDPRVYQISVPVQAGNSGGPLINTRGEAVGIITSKLHAVRVFQWTGDLPQNVNYAIKVFYITPLVEGYGKKGISVLPSKQDSFENLVHRLEKSIFMVIAK